MVGKHCTTELLVSCKGEGGERGSYCHVMAGKDSILAFLFFLLLCWGLNSGTTY
jgi:hypothetical protein